MMMIHSGMKHFDGSTYSHPRDGVRLNRQQAAVEKFMSDARWHTLREIASALSYPEASISARLRDLRKERFGGRLVLRQYIGQGLYQYIMLD